MDELDKAHINQKYAKSLLGDNLIFKINPSHIKKQVRKEYLVGNDWLQHKQFFDYFLIGGCWDKDCTLIENDRNYIEMKELSIFRERFRESQAYINCVRELYDGRPQKGYDGNYFNSILDIDNTFTYYLDLIDSMTLGGYIQELALKKSADECHIGVAIGRTGELFHFRTGHHRLAISKLLNLKSIFIQIHCVHDRIFNNLEANCDSKKIKEVGNIIHKIIKGMNYET